MRNYYKILSPERLIFSEHARERSSDFQFLQRFEAEVIGHGGEPPPIEFRENLRRLARGNIPARERQALTDRLEAHREWIRFLASEVKSLRTKGVIMAERPNFLSNEKFLALSNTLAEHLGQTAQNITPENFPGICDERIYQLLKDAFRRVGADEGSIWILDRARENLVIAYNSGDRPEEVTGFKQPLREGIVGLVVASEQSFMETEVYKNARHNRKLDDKLSVTTYAMIVVPFYFLNECRGVISCVQLMKIKTEADRSVPAAPVPPGFDLHHLSTIQSVALIVRDLIDYRLLRISVAWNQP